MTSPRPWGSRRSAVRSAAHRSSAWRTLLLRYPLPRTRGKNLVIAKSMYMIDLGNRSSGDGMGELTADNPVATEAPPGDATADNPADDAAVAAVRGFNRFYTNVIGLLRGKYLDTPYSLTEARL